MDWDLILNSIEEKKCILFIGPRLLECEQEGTLTEMQIAIQAHLQGKYMHYYEQDELFLFENRTQREKAYRQIKIFLQNQTIAPTFYQQMMAIPFQMVINFSPYLNPEISFPKMEIPYPFDYEFYHKNANVATEIKKTENHCWVYDLFGSIKASESLVLTYDDLFSYVSAILGEKPLPLAFKDTLKNAEYFIFLGFPFEKWYMQLLTRLLHAICGGAENNVIWQAVQEKVASKEEINENILLYEQDLKIEFISEAKGAKDFIRQLHQICEEKHLLRVLSEETEKNTSITVQLKELIEENKIMEVIKKLMEIFISNDEQSDMLTLLSNRNNRNENRFIQGVLDEKDYNLEKNKIIQALLTTINEL